MVWAATVKMRSELRKNFEGTFLLPLVFSCGLSSNWKRIFQIKLFGFSQKLLPSKPLIKLFQQELSQDLTSSNPQNLLVYQYTFAVVTGIILVKFFICLLHVTVSSAVCSFNLCLNANFLGAWSDRILAVTENIQPTVKEELEAEIDTWLDIQAFPAFTFLCSVHEKKM